MAKTPLYRQHPGYTQAIVTLTDSATGRRRDYWLWPHGTPECREAYHCLIAEWESLGRRFPDRHADTNQRGVSTAEPTVGDVVLAYWRSLGEGLGGKRLHSIRATLRLVRQFDGAMTAAAFGPRRLRLIREAMVRGDEAADKARRPWSRGTANDRVRIVVAAFRWAASHEMVPPSLPQALATLEPLKRGRSAAKEGRRVLPVDAAVVMATREHLSRQVRALIDLQLLTGARPGELLGLRASDLDTSGTGGVWVFRPSEH